MAASRYGKKKNCIQGCSSHLKKKKEGTLIHSRELRDHKGSLAEKPKSFRGGFREGR